MSDLLAGRELDLQVARLVFEAKPLEWVPDLSTTWVGMRLVVKRMRELGWDWAIYSEGTVWQASLNEHAKPSVVIREAETLPHAVCLAALAAITSSSKEDV